MVVQLQKTQESFTEHTTSLKNSYQQQLGEIRGQLDIEVKLREKLTFEKESSELKSEKQILELRQEIHHLTLDIENHKKSEELKEWVLFRIEIINLNDTHRKSIEALRLKFEEFKVSSEKERKSTKYEYTSAISSIKSIHENQIQCLEARIHELSENNKKPE